jgi:UDP-3-O-acyl-N-acetylglucosamine deacetylase
MMGTPDDEAGQEAAEEDSDVISLSVPIELDDHGYWDRRCPSDECGFSFKIHHLTSGRKSAGDWSAQQGSDARG